MWLSSHRQACGFYATFYNSRKPKDDLFANICSHCRNVFWLNTDDVAKWNTGDSIIGTYEKAGAKVSAVSTVGQLLNFLVSMSA